MDFSHCLEMANIKDIIRKSLSYYYIFDVLCNQMGGMLLRYLYGSLSKVNETGAIESQEY